MAKRTRAQRIADGLRGRENNLYVLVKGVPGAVQRLEQARAKLPRAKKPAAAKEKIAKMEARLHARIEKANNQAVSIQATLTMVKDLVLPAGQAE